MKRYNIGLLALIFVLFSAPVSATENPPDSQTKLRIPKNWGRRKKMSKSQPTKEESTVTTVTTQTTITHSPPQSPRQTVVVTEETNPKGNQEDVFTIKKEEQPPAEDAPISSDDESSEADVTPPAYPASPNLETKGSEAPETPAINLVTEEKENPSPTPPKGSSTKVKPKDGKGTVSTDKDKTKTDQNKDKAKEGFMHDYRTYSKYTLLAGTTATAAGLAMVFIKELNKRAKNGKKVGAGTAFNKTVKHFWPNAKNIKEAPLLYAGAATMLVGGLMWATKFELVQKIPGMTTANGWFNSTPKVK
ncbi:hypothetical protein KAU11_04690 [Candidatus Babeliales bacterium]|nr:hypothetical protein [Candidatus Babeliales bacterium]